MDGDDALFDVEYEKLVKDNSLIDKLWKYCDLKGEYSEEKKKSTSVYRKHAASYKGYIQLLLKKDDFIDFKEDFSPISGTKRILAEKFSN